MTKLSKDENSQLDWAKAKGYSVYGEDGERKLSPPASVKKVNQDDGKPRPSINYGWRDYAYPGAGALLGYGAWRLLSGDGDDDRKEGTFSKLIKWLTAISAAGAGAYAGHLIKKSEDTIIDERHLDSSGKGPYRYPDLGEPDWKKERFDEIAKLMREKGISAKDAVDELRRSNWALWAGGSTTLGGMAMGARGLAASRFANDPNNAGIADTYDRNMAIAVDSDIHPTYQKINGKNIKVSPETARMEKQFGPLRNRVRAASTTAKRLNSADPFAEFFGINKPWLNWINGNRTGLAVIGAQPKPSRIKSLTRVPFTASGATSLLGLGLLGKGVYDQWQNLRTEDVGNGVKVN